MKRVILLFLILSAVICCNAQNSDKTRPAASLPNLPFKEKYFFVIPFIGGSYRLATLPTGLDPAIQKYLGKLLYGFEYGAYLGRHYRKNVHYGLNFQIFSTSASLDNVQISNASGPVRTGTISNNIRSYILGPVWGHKFIRRASPRAFGLNYSIGYSHYREKSHLQYREVYDGSSLYTMISFNYESNLLSSTSLFGSIGIINSSFINLRVKDLDNGTTQTITSEQGGISMSRINLSIGVKFR